MKPCTAVVCCADCPKVPVALTAFVNAVLQKNKVFSKTQNEIRYVVAAASVVMAALLLVIGCCTGGSASGLSKSITEPVNQLVDVVHSLNRLDFSRKVQALFLIPGALCPPKTTHVARSWGFRGVPLVPPVFPLHLHIIKTPTW